MLKNSRFVLLYMLVFSLFIASSISILFILIIVLHVNYRKLLDNKFYKELQLFYHDKCINKNFSNFININQINEIRKISKYRKIGYGGHPPQYLFSLPLDEKILLTPIIFSHKLELLIFIHSRPEEFYERLLSRRCIEQINAIMVIYITSKSKNDEINKKLKYESDIYKDILQFNEISSYFNLTIQTIHMIVWSCNMNFKYLLKSDIDVFINIPLILYWIKKYNNKHNYYAVGKISKTFVIRDKKYSHYVPTEIIKENMFPPYLQGVGYIIPYNTVKLLSNSIEKVKPRIWIEDVFMGYMFKYNNISLNDISKYILRDIPINITKLFKNIKHYMLIHGLYPIEIYMLKKRNRLCFNDFIN